MQLGDMWYVSSGSRGVTPAMHKVRLVDFWTSTTDQRYAIVDSERFARELVVMMSDLFETRLAATAELNRRIKPLRDIAA